MKIMPTLKPSLITGSRAYGTPKDQSDIDLVVRLSPGDHNLLLRLTNKKRGEPLYFLNLNLIVCETDEEWAVWVVGTAQMKKSGRTYSRDEAITLFKGLRESMGIKDHSVSGDE